VTDNHKLHAAFASSTESRRPANDEGKECGCVYRGDGEQLVKCSRHGTPKAGDRSPLNASVRRKSHTHKTGSPIARTNRRTRQLAREGFDTDHKKKRKGQGG
jgi:hypothetical protein